MSCSARSLLGAAVWMIPGLSAWIGAAYGQNLQTLQQTGSPDNRVDIVILGDGYTQGQIDQFYVDANRFVDYAFGQAGQEPFGRYARFFNIHAVEVISAESGADVPDEGIYVETALDASYGQGSEERILKIDTNKAYIQAGLALGGTGIDIDLPLATVNSDRHGGWAGSWAVWPGSSAKAGETAVHEIGHVLGGLADEYWYGTRTYTGAEPNQPNVTTDPSGARWSHWMGYDEPDDGISAVGVYQGAKYYSHGIYRPTDTSKMRALYEPFNAPSREALVLAIYDELQVFDGYLGAEMGLETIPVLGRSVWVDVVDPDVIQVDWWVDGQLVAADAGESFDVYQAGFGPGTYSVEAIARDPTEWVRTDLEKLTGAVQFEVTFTDAPGDADGDFDVDFADFALLSGQYGTAVQPGHGADFNGDGVVGSADLDLLERYMGLEYAGSGQNAGVPEPAGMTALVLLGLAAIRRRG